MTKRGDPLFLIEEIRLGEASHQFLTCAHSLSDLIVAHLSPLPLRLPFDPAFARYAIRFSPVGMNREPRSEIEIVPVQEHGHSYRTTAKIVAFDGFNGLSSGPFT